MTILRIGCLLVCYLCASLLCRAESLHVYCDNWPGFCQTDGQGFYLDLVNSIYQPHGYTIVPHIVPYKRALTMVARNKGDMALGAYLHELDNVRMPEYPDSADDLSAIMLNQWQPQWHGEQSLAGQPVIWQRGWALDKYIAVPMNWHEVDSYEMALQLLEKERYRYYMTVGVLHVANPPPTSMSRIFLRWIPTYPVFSDSERGETLQQLWDREMVNLIRSGELANIYRRHQLYDYYQGFIKEMEQKGKVAPIR